jgi:hypothetical protein
MNLDEIYGTGQIEITCHGCGNTEQVEADRQGHSNEDLREMLSCSCDSTIRYEPQGVGFSGMTV